MCSNFRGACCTLQSAKKVQTIRRSEIDTANEQWHKVREEKLRADNLAQQRASLESRIEDLESDCLALQQQMQEDKAKQAPLESKRQQYVR